MRRVATALGVLALFWSLPEIAHAREAQLGGKAILEVEPATVGKPTLVHWSRATRVKTTLPPAFLTLSIQHLEKKKLAFAIEHIPVARDFSMKFHFTDGGRYRVRIVADVPGDAPVVNQTLVDVTGTEPPVRTTIPALLLFIGFLAAGLAAGRWSKQRKRRKSSALVL